MILWEQGVEVETDDVAVVVDVVVAAACVWS